MGRTTKSVFGLGNVPERAKGALVYGEIEIFHAVAVGAVVVIIPATKLLPNRAH